MIISSKREIVNAGNHVNKEENKVRIVAHFTTGIVGRDSLFFFVIQDDDKPVRVQRIYLREAVATVGVEDLASDKGRVIRCQEHKAGGDFGRLSWTLERWE